MALSILKAVEKDADKLFLPSLFYISIIKISVVIYIFKTSLLITPFQSLNIFYLDWTEV